MAKGKGARCKYVDPETGERCESRATALYAVEGTEPVGPVRIEKVSGEKVRKIGLPIFCDDHAAEFPELVRLTETR